MQTQKIKSMGKRAVAVILSLAALWTMPTVTAEAVSANGALARGVDVSKHNGAINWGQVAGSGMNFTFIKVGSTYSGIDPNFASNITNAQAAGLKTGVYIYSYATTPEAAANEANLVLQWIDGYTVNYPVVFDIEDKCHKNLSSQQLIDIINAFCSVIDAAGYYPMVYSNKNMFAGKLSTVGWDKWVAQYNDTCEYNNNVCFWQYTSSGKVNGFGGRVDVNYQYKDYSNLIIPEGFLQRNSQTRFYRNWRMQKGWVDYNETRYYLDGAGNMVRGWFTDPAGTYYLSFADGSIARGQCQIDGGDYYFDEQGIKRSGWIVLGEQRFYYEPANNGIMKRDWFSDETGSVYFFDRTDGHMLVGGQVIDGAEFLFNHEGKRQTGWITLPEGVFYYDTATGAKVRGFMEDAKGRRYLAQEDGHMVTGAVTIDNKEYYFNAEGVMMTGMTAREDGTFYYDTATGQMLFGFITLEDKTYYADEAGHIVTGVYTIRKQPYYFDETGVLMRNFEVILDGISYTTTPEGILVQNEEAQAGAALEAQTGAALEAQAGTAAEAVQ